MINSRTKVYFTKLKNSLCFHHILAVDRFSWVFKYYYSLLHVFSFNRSRPQVHHTQYTHYILALVSFNISCPDRKLLKSLRYNNELQYFILPVSFHCLYQVIVVNPMSYDSRCYQH